MIAAGGGQNENLVIIRGLRDAGGRVLTSTQCKSNLDSQLPEAEWIASQP